MPVPNGETYLVHQPEAIMPATGWRAAYIHEPGEDGPGWSAAPLVAFAICHVTREPCAGSTAARGDEGRVIHGYINMDPRGSYIDCAEELSNFWCYLAPGDEPTDADVAGERKTRYRHAS